MRSTWNFYTAGQLTFGPGSVLQLGALATRRELSRVFVVTDRTLVQLGITKRVVEPLRAAGISVEIFDGGEAEPSIAVAVAAIDQARPFRPNAILGLGGGSNMDLSKITATVLSHGGGPSDYFGFDRVPGPVMPLICVPTTAGTGSEVSHAAVLTDSENQMKVSTLSNWLRPTLAIVDPELTYSCPKQVTADSGIDALTHAIEGYTATDYRELVTPPGEACAYEGSFLLGDVIAEKAIRMIGANLVQAVNEPDNRQARDNMALASTLAGIAFSNCGVALVHALEYPMGGALHCSHGAGNGLLLPFVMRFNLPERKVKFAKIAELLGASVCSDVDTMARRAVESVEQLKRDIGIPERIRDIGGNESHLPKFAEKAFAIKRLLWVNPRKASLEDLLGILEAAL
ncbi:MAG: iron-containing alcohol dehydrogenase [Planctomycetaceae bacterium]|nr:iron-containing alcohol dehydrogenase [Planctomycetales bacterium]MCB9922862.1 iron-containing alcohol dehydrogenase [Planctomycetaceae bacterium]